MSINLNINKKLIKKNTYKRVSTKKIEKKNKRDREPGMLDLCIWPILKRVCACGPFFILFGNEVDECLPRIFQK